MFDIGLDFGAAAGSLAGGLFGSRSQNAANKANLKMMREQNAFNERMRDTAVDSQITQYKRNGINPILAADKSAASPQSASAAPQQSEGDYGVGNAVSKGLAAKQIAASIAQTKSNIGLQSAQSHLMNEQALSQESLRSMQSAQSAAALAAAGFSNASAAIQGSLGAKADADANLARANTRAVNVNAAGNQYMLPVKALQGYDADRHLNQQINSSNRPWGLNTIIDIPYYMGRSLGIDMK